jgi:hypothetical protein
LGFLLSRLLLCSPLAMSISLGFDGYVGIAYPQSPIDAAGNAVMIKLGLRPGDSERKNGTGRSRTCPGQQCLTPKSLWDFPRHRDTKSVCCTHHPSLAAMSRKVMDVWI